MTIELRTLAFHLATYGIAATILTGCVQVMLAVHFKQVDAEVREYKEIERKKLNEIDSTIKKGEECLDEYCYVMVHTKNNSTSKEIITGGYKGKEIIFFNDGIHLITINNYSLIIYDFNKNKISKSFDLRDIFTGQNGILYANFNKVILSEDKSKIFIIHEHGSNNINNNYELITINIEENKISRNNISSELININLQNTSRSIRIITNNQDIFEQNTNNFAYFSIRQEKNYHIFRIDLDSISITSKTLIESRFNETTREICPHYIFLKNTYIYCEIEKLDANKSIIHVKQFNYNNKIISSYRKESFSRRPYMYTVDQESKLIITEPVDNNEFLNILNIDGNFLKNFLFASNEKYESPKPSILYRGGDYIYYTIKKDELYTIYSENIYNKSEKKRSFSMYRDTGPGLSISSDGNTVATNSYNLQIIKYKR